MTVISQIEEVMGQPYGVAPKHVNNTYLNRYLFFLSKNGYSLKNIISTGFFYADIYKGHSGFYEAAHHTVFTRDSSHRADRFTKLHEYTHGYNSQRNGNFMKERTFERLNIAIHGTPAEFEAMTIHLALDEGICDYTAAQVERLEKARGRDPKELFFYRREAQLFSRLRRISKKERHRLDLLDFSKKDTAFIPKLGEVALKLQKAVIAKDSSAFTKEELDLTSMAKYILGYIAARAIFKDEMTGIGKKAEILLKRPPRTFKGLEELAFYS